MGSEPGKVINVLRLLLMLVVVGGGTWYVLRMQRHKEAIVANNAASEKIKSGDYKEALELLQKAAKKGYDNDEIIAVVARHKAMAYAAQGIFLFSKKKYLGALKLLQKVKKYSSKLVVENRVNYYIGASYMSLSKDKNNTGKAIVAFKKALEDDSEDTEAKLMLVRCKNRMLAIPLQAEAKIAFAERNYTIAKENYEELANNYRLFMEVPDAYPWYHLALISLSRGEGKEALKMLNLSEEKQGTLAALKKKHSQLRAAIKKKFPELKLNAGTGKFESLFE